MEEYGEAPCFGEASGCLIEGLPCNYACWDETLTQASGIWLEGVRRARSLACEGVSERFRHCRAWWSRNTILFSRLGLGSEPRGCGN